MTVGELLKADIFCELAEIIVRADGAGQWIQGYRIGEKAKIYPSEFQGFGVTWTQPEPGEEVDIQCAFKLPMRIIKKPVEKAPDYIKNLRVCNFVPYDVPLVTRMERNEHMLSICCYPDGYTAQDLQRMIDEANPSVETDQISLDEIFEL